MIQPLLSVLDEKTINKGLEVAVTNFCFKTISKNPD
jgi:hypothetical protein